MTKKLIGAIVVLFVLGGLSAIIYVVANNKIVVGYNQGYEPTQPIPYSHELHAGTYKIDCKYCHTGVETSRHALVPSLNICMNCHMMVNPGSELIQKISSAYASKKPIAWQKVHLLPDHVKFDHSAHVNAGKDCRECHGDIEKMAVVKQVKSLSMGFCVNCHQKPENNAPTNCSTCHQ